MQILGYTQILAWLDDRNKYYYIEPDGAICFKNGGKITKELAHKYWVTTQDGVRYKFTSQKDVINFINKAFYMGAYKEFA